MEALRLLSNDLDELRFESSQSCLDEVDILIGECDTNTSEIVRAVLLVHAADCHKHLGQYKKSLDLCQSAVKTLSVFPVNSFYPRALNSLASIQGAMGNTSDALKNALKALEHSEENGFRSLAARCCITVSYIHCSVGQYDSALAYCLRVDKEACDWAMRVILIINTSDALDYLGRHEEALALIEEGIALVESMQDRRHYTLLINIKTCIFASLGRDGEADALLKIAEDYTRSSNYPHNVPNPSYELGTRYLRLGNYDLAARYLERASSLCEEFKRESLLVDLRDKLASAYSALGRHDEAITLLRSVVLALKQQATVNVLEENESYAFEQLDWMKREFELLREVNQTVAKAKAAVEESSRVKTELLANISHEIRTPMNGIIGLAKKLSASPLADEQRATIQDITICGQNLLSIVDDILALSEIEKGKLRINRQPFNLSLALANLEGICHTLAHQKGLAYKVHSDPAISQTVMGDEARFRQLILNFVGNAVKFTELGSIEVSVVKISEPGRLQRVRVSVIDTGTGISEHAQEAILRGDVAEYSLNSRKYGGNGLGLMISRNIIAALGGSFGLTSKLNVGTTVWFELDLAISDEESVPREPIEDEASLVITKPFSGLRILVAEDNIINWIVTESLVQSLGATVEWARDGVEAVEMDDQKAFDVILMDCHMPKMDGYEAASIISERDKLAGRTKTILALSADVMKTNKELCFAHGMRDFLSKPIDTAELVAKVNAFRTIAT